LAGGCTTWRGGEEELELLARGRHIAQALGKHLPADDPEAIEVLLRSLGPEHASDELLGAGMAPYLDPPHTIFVAERWLDRKCAADSNPHVRRRASEGLALKPVSRMVIRQEIGRPCHPKGDRP